MGELLLPLNMKRKIDVDNWVRKAHFEFFSTFEEPYYGVCVNIDCSAAYRFAKRSGISVFLYYLFQSLSAAQRIEPFKQRIEGREVFVHDRIDAGSTVARSNGTFGYGYFRFSKKSGRFFKRSQTQSVSCPHFQ